MRTATFVLLAALALGGKPAAAGILNGGFEQPAYSGTGYKLVNQSSVNGWRTTASDSVIEFWHGSFQGVVAQEGRQHVELNANQVSTLYQDVAGLTAGARVGFEFAHRGRNGVDTMRLTLTDIGANGQLGGGDDTVLFTNTYASGNTAWQVYSGGNIRARGNTVRFAFESISATGGSQSIGNFLDNVSFGTNVGVQVAVPEPGTLGLLALPMLALAASRRRRKAT